MVASLRHLTVFHKMLNPPPTGMLAGSGFLNESNFRHNLVIGQPDKQMQHHIPGELVEELTGEHDLPQ
ncbi:hypothetical protein SAMN05428984_4527 [Sphingomonas sp. OK281]|nr:hypothetical protein SAMN05428984_4527 [Sphingomonas sp. OK281]